MQTFIKDCRWGKFMLLRGDMISIHADLYGEWSEMEVRLFSKVLNPESVIVEVGANLGLHTVPLARIAHRGKVVCFEPQRIIFQMLCGNLALNNLTNVHAFQAAVSDTEGTVEIETSDYQTPWNYGSFSVDRGMSTEGAYPGCVSLEMVSTVTLDQFAATAKLPRVDFLKIDAEQHEIPVLNGAMRLIAKHRPIIFLENNNQEQGDRLIDHVNALDYQPYWYCSKRFQPDNYNRVGYELPGADINMVCFPDGRLPVQGLVRAERFANLADGKVPVISQIS